MVLAAMLSYAIGAPKGLDYLRDPSPNRSRRLRAYAGAGRMSVLPAQYLSLGEFDVLQRADSGELPSIRSDVRCPYEHRGLRETLFL
ncbi:hypothetical protein BCAR13_1560026 [Paraburkholderia caribensis]|nr:hypothetical protein BCAR13_1560026 [Paraburkholderia caribensis]